MESRLVAVNEQGIRVGEDHPRARYTDGEVEMVLNLRERDGFSYDKISKLMEMPKGTVRDFCKYRRRAQTAAAWKRVSVDGQEIPPAKDSAPRFKLTDWEVEMIRTLRERDGKSYGDIAKLLGQSKSTVAHICQNRRRVGKDNTSNLT